MSAESYAEQQFEIAKADPAFLARLHPHGRVEQIIVVAGSTPVREMLAWVEGGAFLAVHDEDEPHGFALVWIVQERDFSR